MFKDKAADILCCIILPQFEPDMGVGLKVMTTNLNFLC